MQTPEERWRPVARFDGRYEVSDLGRVRRAVPGKRTYPGRLLAQRPGRGYPRVAIYWRGQNVHPTVHVLVATAFVGPRPPGYQVNHIDAVKTNNRADNLEWVSPGDNLRHAHSLGLIPADRKGVKGSAHHKAKLTDDQVRAIRAEKGRTIHAVLAARYGVSFSTIALIQQGKAWTHLNAPDPG